MSATINAGKFVDYFDAALMNLPGNTFPVKTFYSQSTDASYLAEAYELVVYLRRTFESNVHRDVRDFPHFAKRQFPADKLDLILRGVWAREYHEMFLWFGEGVCGDAKARGKVKGLLLSRAKKRVEIGDLIQTLWEVVLEEEGHNDYEEFPTPTGRHVRGYHHHRIRGAEDTSSDYVAVKKQRVSRPAAEKKESEPEMLSFCRDRGYIPPTELPAPPRRPSIPSSSSAPSAQPFLTLIGRVGRGARAEPRGRWDRCVVAPEDNADAVFQSKAKKGFMAPPIRPPHKPNTPLRPSKSFQALGYEPLDTPGPAGRRAKSSAPSYL
ncbi:hypothetical protein CONLIGDRAFT_684949 [Coniochaeta ligniaria NRRL 30616]|uniref:Uncharacterized protein n=1 Tax=Coniochaeta ligniaria NRRL 30616 TaxID=1408157 RepID=A0A1J7ICC2_9PEZI|nr:hypothetical protein CONLIGDRAFT_684949 [Coniochaeta ligniaria NRRL 30616]